MHSLVITESILRFSLTKEKLYNSAFSMDSSILIEIFYWIYIIFQEIIIYKLYFQ